MISAKRGWLGLVVASLLVGTSALPSRAADDAARCTQKQAKAKHAFAQCLAKCDTRAAGSAHFNLSRCHQSCDTRFAATVARMNKLAVCKAAPVVQFAMMDISEREITGVVTIDENADDDVFDPDDLTDAGCITIDGIGGAFDCAPNPGGGGPNPDPGNPPFPPPPCLPPEILVNGHCVECEIGVIDPAGHCCASGVIDRLGTCCAPGVAIGVGGRCNVFGNIVVLPVGSLQASAN